MGDKNKHVSSVCVFAIFAIVIIMTGVNNNYCLTDKEYFLANKDGLCKPIIEKVKTGEMKSDIHVITVTETKVSDIPEKDVRKEFELHMKENHQTDKIKKERVDVKK